MMPATINEADYAEALRLAAKIEKMGWSKEGYTALIAKALLAADAKLRLVIDHRRRK